MITDDMLIIIMLPQPLVEMSPSFCFHPLNINMGRIALKLPHYLCQINISQ